DIARLFYRLDFLRALQASMWLINRSQLKINSLALNYRIGEILSETSKMDLYNSAFMQNSLSENIDRGWLILSALTEQPDNTFWIEEYKKRFNLFQMEMKKYSKKKRGEKINSKFVNPVDAQQALSDL